MNHGRKGGGLEWGGEGREGVSCVEMMRVEEFIGGLRFEEWEWVWGKKGDG